mgnify:CR=1 FL=1
MQSCGETIISLKALVQCFRLTVAELEQLESWIYHYPELLLEVKRGYFEFRPILAALQKVFNGTRPGYVIKEKTFLFVEAAPKTED